MTDWYWFRRFRLDLVTVERSIAFIGLRLFCSAVMTAGQAGVNTFYIIVLFRDVNPKKAGRGGCDLFAVRKKRDSLKKKGGADPVGWQPPRGVLVPEVGVEPTQA